VRHAWLLEADSSDLLGHSIVTLEEARRKLRDRDDVLLVLRRDEAAGQGGDPG